VEGSFEARSAVTAASGAAVTVSNLALFAPDVLAILEEGNGLALGFAFFIEDDLRRILREINAPQLVGEVGPAAMENVAGEGHDASGRHDGRNARLLAEIADEIVRASHRRA